MKKYVLLSVIAVTSTIAINAFSEPATDSIEKLVSEIADTPEQHIAIANYYKEKAAKAREEAAEHARMASKRIGHSKSALTQENWKNHCKKLSSTLEEAAKEYDALANMHSDAVK